MCGASPPAASVTRSRGIPNPDLRGSPVSGSKKPSNEAFAPVRSGSPSRQSSRMTQRVPGRISSTGRGWRWRGRPRAGRGADGRRTGARDDGTRDAGGGVGCAGACVGRSGRRPRRGPRGRRRRGGRSCMRELYRASMRRGIGPDPSTAYH
jgi:hypothetical protein